jgi:hypothetical protein
MRGRQQGSCRDRGRDGHEAPQEHARLAVLVTFMSVTHVGEQIRRGTFRVAGTAVVIILGAMTVQLSGSDVGWTVVVMLVAGVRALPPAPQRLAGPTGAR